MLRLLIALIVVSSSVPVKYIHANIPENNTKSSFEFYVIPYAGPDEMEMEVVLENTSSHPLTFEFSTSQKYELKIKNENREEVYLYSKGLSFLQALQTITLKPGENIKWKEVWDYLDEGKRVKEGDYQIEALLTGRLKDSHSNLGPSQINTGASVYIPGENPVFRNAKVSGEKGKYLITGQARPLNGELYYSVEDGHNEFVNESMMQANKSYPEWSNYEIKISIPEEELPKNAVLILNLYERSKGDRRIIHSYPVILEKL